MADDYPNRDADDYDDTYSERERTYYGGDVPEDGVNMDNKPYGRSFDRERGRRGPGYYRRGERFDNADEPGFYPRRRSKGGRRGGQRDDYGEARDHRYDNAHNPDSRDMRRSRDVEFTSGWGRYPGGPYKPTQEEWMQEGPHTGRGPKGYQRSKERVLEEINDRLSWHGGLDASDISVSVDDNNEVTLEGTVKDRRAKRMAEDAIDSVRGVRDVHNRLRIANTSSGDASGTSDQS